MREEFRILSTTAILGYGFPAESFREGMERNPHLIAVDAGSTDPGPYYLGAGVSFTDRGAVKRDLEFMIKAGVERKIPVCIGTAGGSGGEPHLRWNREIIEEIAQENGLNFKLAVIHAELSKEAVKNAYSAGKIKVSESASLGVKLLDETSRVVAQMGVEPFIKAYEGGADVILAGRAYDPAVFLL